MIGHIARLTLLLTTLFLSILGLHGSIPERETADLRPILAYAARFRQLQAADLYKITYQSTRGPGHFAADVDHVLLWIDREMEEIGDKPSDEPLYVEIGNGYVQVNLIPYAAAGGSLKELAHQMVQSADPQSSSEDTKRLWKDVLLLNAEGLLPRGLSMDLMQVSQIVRLNNYPAVHHSDHFNGTYSPHYRLVKTSSLPKLGISAPSGTQTKW